MCRKYPSLKLLRKFQTGFYELFKKQPDGELEARQKLNTLIKKNSYQKNPYLKKACSYLKRNRLELFCYQNYENLDSTTNHVERLNRWFRKRQKGHYRNRKKYAIENMLLADLVRWKSLNGRIRIKLKRRGDINYLFESSDSCFCYPYSPH